MKAHILGVSECPRPHVTTSSRWSMTNDRTSHLHSGGGVFFHQKISLHLISDPINSLSTPFNIPGTILMVSLSFTWTYFAWPCFSQAGIKAGIKTSKAYNKPQTFILWKRSICPKTALAPIIRFLHPTS